MADPLPPGWLSDDEAFALASAAAGLRVLEIGSWVGRSTVALAQTAAHVVSLDNHRGSAEHAGLGSSLPQLLDNLERWEVRERVSVVVMEARHAADFLLPAFQMAFIDGAHDFESVLRDGDQAHRLTAGLHPLYFHDYGGGWETVTAAVNRLAEQWGAGVLHVTGSLVRLLPHG